jgi:protein TonB
MRRVALVLSLVLLPAMAWADTPDSAVKATGRPHTCTEFYPDTAATAQAEGTTTLSFRITSQGTTADVAVSKSSGNADLDAAAIQCVSGWHYLPATKDGKPIDYPWQANVQWKLTDDLTPPTAANAHVCRNYPHAALWNESNGKATVGFRVTADGAVADPVIVTSAGDDALDAAALACVMAWRYKPATVDGVAVDYKWEASVEWSTHPGDLPPPTPPCARYADVTADMLVGIAGVTRVSFRIMPDGSTADLEVLRGSGNSKLDDAALKCMGDRHFDVARAKIPPTGFAQTVVVDWHADVPKP